MRQMGFFPLTNKIKHACENEDLLCIAEAAQATQLQNPSREYKFKDR
jgi:hypothetical protein